MTIATAVDTKCVHCHRTIVLNGSVYVHASTGTQTCPPPKPWEEHAAKPDPEAPRYTVEGVATMYYRDNTYCVCGRAIVRSSRRPEWRHC